MVSKLHIMEHFNKKPFLCKENGFFYIENVVSPFAAPNGLLPESGLVVWLSYNKLMISVLYIPTLT